MGKEIIEENGIEVINEINEVIENELILSLTREHKFEGKTYQKIDLTGLEELTASDMIEVGRTLDKTGNFSFNQEMTIEYACILCARATKQPIEFFKSLHPKDAIKLKNRVVGFLYGQD